MMKPLMVMFCVALIGCTREQKIPSFFATAESPTADRTTQIFEDSHYIFIGHGYGERGEDTPSVFVYRKRSDSWIRISMVSTEGASFGRSPDMEHVPISVGWDHSKFAQLKYVAFPLITGAVLLPDSFEFVPERRAYRILIGSRYGEFSHPTIFYLHVDDLDQETRG